jgi:predicted HTH domain antitoxin
MNVIGIKQLQTDVKQLSHNFEHNEYTLITRKGKPIGIALPFSDELMQSGLKAWLAMRAFEKGDLSLGQLADSLGKTKADTLQVLAQFNIPVADYDLQKDLEFIKNCFPYKHRVNKK